MKGNDTKHQTKQNSFKKLIFSIILMCLPVILLLFLELFLRIIHYGDNYKLFIDFPGKDFHEYKYINPEIGKKYFQKLDYNRPCGDMFLKEKPANGFRIFVLGSSTVLGFPYNQNLMFSRILLERLQDCYPDKKVEVINTALTAINSFTLLDYMDDVLKEDPDAILIYAGHNEFYGAFGVGSIERTISSRRLTLLHLDLLSLRLYQFIRNFIGTISKSLAGGNSIESDKGTLMKRIADNKEITYKDKIYNIGIEYYRKNMDMIVKKATHNRVPVFISEVCSNVKDLSPFCSVDTELYPLASEVYRNAVKGEQNGRLDAAKELYYQAKDLDCIRFRASEEINETIHKLAEKYNAYLVPMKEKYFEEVSPNRLIGNNLMTEHVHPNIKGYFLMADAFFNELTASGVMGEKLNPVCYESSDYYQRNWGYTELDSLVGQHVVTILRSYWPFQSLESSSDPYRRTYEPNTLIDSLAFEVATTSSFRIDDAHLVLADVYIKHGDYLRAFKEYYSNIMFDPFQIRDYQHAIRCCILTNDFPLALKLINKSLELKETFYAQYTMGEILFLKEDYTRSIEALNRAYILDNSMIAKLQVLSSLHKVYHYKGDKAKATEILSEIRKLNPDFQPVYPDEKKRYVYYVPLQVEDQINRAYQLYRSGNFNEALVRFLKTLDIKETSLANRCIGDIMFTRNDSKAILYYQKAFPDYKNNINFLFNMGILYLQCKQQDSAKEVLEEIRKLDPDFEKIPLLEQEIH